MMENFSKVQNIDKTNPEGWSESNQSEREKALRIAAQELLVEALNLLNPGAVSKRVKETGEVKHASNR